MLIKKKTSIYVIVERAHLKTQDQPPRGFVVVQSIPAEFGTLGRSEYFKIILPQALAAELTRTASDESGEADAAGDEGEEGQSQPSVGSPSVLHAALAEQASKKQSPQEKLLAELTAQSAAPALPAPHAQMCSSLVAIYPMGEPVKLLGQHGKSSDATLRKRNDGLLEQLKLLGNQRHLLRPFQTADSRESSESSENQAVKTSQTIKTIAQALLPLRQHHPHFRAVIDLFETTATAAAINDHPFKPPPVLMLGAPGIGKTHFTQDLARVLGMPLHRIAYDSGVTNSELMGSAQYWGNTHPGKLFSELCLGAIANPIFILEEIDKAADHGSTQGVGRNALNALHTLLEPSSSANVTDLSTNMSFDASHVVWLATANEARGIIPTVLSRFAVFHILPPIGEDAWLVATHLARSVTERLRCDKLAGTLVTALAVLSPREQRKALEQACMRATAAGRRAVQAADLPPGLLDEELHSERVKAPKAGDKQPYLALHPKSGKASQALPSWIH